MDRSGRHKGVSERALLAARGKISTVMETERISDSSRAELEAVCALIRSMELAAGQQRMGDARPQHPRMEFLRQEGVQEHALQHREQLLQLYTDCDLEAAEGNRAASPRKSHTSKGAELRRLSTRDLDERVTAALTSEVACGMVSQVGTLDFDSIALAEAVQPCLFVVFAALEDRLRLIKHVRDLGQVGNGAEFHAKLAHFMDKISTTYQDTNPYHNSLHAADVVSTIEWFFRSDYLHSVTSPLDHLIALIGGAIHDVGHPGQNNMFHQKTLSHWAIRYNDKSILENMHVSLSFEIMQSDPECNWFGLLTADGAKGGEASTRAGLQQYVRKALVQMTLATDMGKHAKTVQDLKIFVEEQAEPAEAAQGEEKHEKHLALENKLFTLDTVVHAADISNPGRPQPIMLKWTKRVLAEFWAQGDEEKRLGLPVSPLCDRETEQWVIPKGQIGFINFVVQPLYAPLQKLIPEVQELLDHLKSNAAFWEEQNTAKATHAEIFAAV